MSKRRPKQVPPSNPNLLVHDEVAPIEVVRTGLKKVDIGEYDKPNPITHGRDVETDYSIGMNSRIVQNTSKKRNKKPSKTSYHESSTNPITHGNDFVDPSPPPPKRLPKDEDEDEDGVERNPITHGRVAETDYTRGQQSKVVKNSPKKRFRKPSSKDTAQTANPIWG